MDKGCLSELGYFCAFTFNIYSDEALYMYNNVLYRHYAKIVVKGLTNSARAEGKGTIC